MDGDAIIVGGGLVGGALALALAAHGLRSVVVDRATLEATATEAYDARVSAIASASARMLGAIGLGHVIERHGQPISAIRATDALSPLHVHFDAAAAGTGPLGWMVENRFLRAALLEAMRGEPLIELLAPATLTDHARGPAAAKVTLAGGRTLRAPLLVAADGRHSPLRAAAGIRMAEWDYGATALVTTVSHPRPHGGVAFELFFPTGPLALLPMRDSDAGDRRCAIVWTVGASEAEGWGGLAPAALARELTARVDGFLGDFSVASPVTRYPLRLQHAATLTAHRLALVGDAGHVIHPIAGQGLNLGLRDVAALTQVLVEDARLGVDPGTADRLARYQRWRRADIGAVTAATDLLSRLFGVAGRPAAAVRRIGLAAVDRLPALKARFMAEARGEAGQLPALLRGELA